MVSKECKQELRDLESGLKSLNEMLKGTTNRRTYEKVMIKIPVQEARIDFFKKGYNFRDREITEQTKL